MPPPRRFILTIACPDRTGIVAAVSGFIAEHHGWILEAGQHSENESKRFYMRYEVLAESLPFDLSQFRERFRAVADAYDMRWSIADSSVKKRMVILVSRQEHCLADLLHRYRVGELDIDLCAVISNHRDLESYVGWHDVPFHHVPVPAGDPEAKNAAFAQVGELFERYDADAYVLARFMQILPPSLCERYAGRIINIHHSFLPSFIGARPYHQAFERGVKLIGATCHYVTAELDAGPIIEQDVVRVDHSDQVDDLVRLGRDVEKAVLARGVRYHIEDRVLIHERKTIVFT